jgi:hypothetical protein
MRTRSGSILLVAALWSAGCGSESQTVTPRAVPTPPAVAPALATPKPRDATTTPPGATPAAAAVAKPWVDVPALAQKSSKEVDKALGKPVMVTPIEKPYVDQMPGEHRLYFREGVEEPIQVRFLRGKAVSLVVPIPRVGSAREALRSIGIDIGDRTPDVSAPKAMRWVGVTAGGTPFAEVVAQGSDNAWSTVAATTPHAFNGK